MKKFEEIYSIVVLGIAIAIPLAYVSFSIHKLGWRFSSVIFLPIFCSFYVGRYTAINKWMRDMDEFRKNYKNEKNSKD
jgi:hypothetical protein